MSLTPVLYEKPSLMDHLPSYNAIPTNLVIAEDENNETIFIAGLNKQAKSHLQSSLNSPEFLQGSIVSDPSMNGAINYVATKQGKLLIPVQNGSEQSNKVVTTQRVYLSRKSSLSSNADATLDFFTYSPVSADDTYLYLHVTEGLVSDRTEMSPDKVARFSVGPSSISVEPDLKLPEPPLPHGVELEGWYTSAFNIAVKVAPILYKCGVDLYNELKKANALTEKDKELQSLEGIDVMSIVSVAAPIALALL